MKKIVIFNSSSSVYGAEKGLLNFIRAAKENYSITVFLPNEGDLVGLIKKENVQVKIFPLAVLKNSFSPFYLLKLILLSILDISYFYYYIKRNKIDIVYSNTALMIFPLAVSKLTNCLHVWHLREFFPHRLANRLIGRLAGYSWKIVCMSENIKQNLGLRGENVSVIYDALEISDKRNNSYLEKELKIVSDAAVISIISRIHPLKGQLEFLEFAKDIIKNSNTILLLVGDITLGNRRDKAYKRKIKEFINNNHLRTKVFLLGFRLDALEIINVSDICIFPFLRNEPFGLAMAESLAMGKKTLFYDNAGSREVNELFGNTGEILTLESLIRSIAESKLASNELVINIPYALRFDQYRASITKLLERYE